MSLIFATELTAVATLALAVLALAAAILAGLALRKQSREVAILVGQSEREARERRIAQASQVFIWTETTDSPVVEGMQRPVTPYRAIVAHLQNTSQQPVYDVTITWRKQGEPGEGSLVPIGPVLMPGQQEDRGTIFDPRGNPRIPTYPGVAANFRDAAGVHWRASPYEAPEETGDDSEMTRKVMAWYYPPWKRWPDRTPHAPET